MSAVRADDVVDELPACCAGSSSVPWRWATPHTPGRRSYGAAIAAVAAKLGKPLMPWQLHIAYVSTELLDDGSWAYPDVLITVQRQAGKTTLLTPLHLHRGLIRPAGKTWHVDARTRQDARDTWIDAADLVELSPLAELFTVRRSNGSEAITGPARATFRITPPDGDGLHGKANDLVDADEIWAYTEADGEAFLAGARPSFLTTGGQLVLLSTAGTSDSTWMRTRVDRGRAAVDAGERVGLAYFECSITADQAATVAAGLDPDNADVTVDQAVELLAAAHPAAGHTLKRGALRAAITDPDMTIGQKLRAYGNHWTDVSDRAIAEHVWKATQLREDQLPVEPPAVGGMVLAFAAAIDRSRSAIVAAWRPTPASSPRVMVVDAREGTSWLPARMAELARTWRPYFVAHAGAGPALDLADQVERAGVELVAPKARDYVASHSAYLSALIDRRIEHVPSTSLDDAVAAAARRDFPEGGFVWSRRQSGGSIAELEAATVAAWYVDRRPAPLPRPAVVVSRHLRDELPARRPPATAQLTAHDNARAGKRRVSHPG